MFWNEHSHYFSGGVGGAFYHRHDHLFITASWTTKKYYLFVYTVHIYRVKLSLDYQALQPVIYLTEHLHVPIS